MSLGPLRCTHVRLRLVPGIWLNWNLYLGHVRSYYQFGAGRALLDDGIIFIPDRNGHKTSMKIIRAFKLIDLQIEIVSNLKIVDFLDVAHNLNNGTFKPFSKSNSTPTYININTNYSRSLLKQIPNALNRKINRLSSCKRIFEKSKSIYDEVLKNNGIQGRLVYVNPVNSGLNGRSNSSGTATRQGRWH